MNTFTQAPVLASYVNGGYRVTLHADGTKIRETLDASRPPRLNEHADLKITGWCDAGCAWCHEKSTPSGKHGDMKATLKLLSVMPAGSEIAIGGGDPLSHPDFQYLVEGLSDMGILPSVTVNGLHFDRHRAVLEDLTSRQKLWGVGFSYADKLPDWDYANLVIHLITGVHAPAVLDEAQRRYKVLLLGYKRFGRGERLFELRPEPVQNNIAAWFRELFRVARMHHLSFDNLAIDQLRPERIFRDRADYERQWMGPEGDFSMYIDAVEQTFALSSYASERTPWSTLPEMFAHVRKSQGFPVAGEETFC